MMRRQNFNKKHITRRNLDGQLQHTYTRIHLYTYTQPQSVHRSICGLLGKAVHFLEINTSAPQKGTEQLENLCQHHLKGLLSTPSLSQTPTKHKLSTVKPFIYIPLLLLMLLNILHPIFVLWFIQRNIHF